MCAVQYYKIRLLREDTAGAAFAASLFLGWAGGSWVLSRAKHACVAKLARADAGAVVVTAAGLVWFCAGADYLLLWPAPKGLRCAGGGQVPQPLAVVAKGECLPGKAGRVELSVQVCQ